MKSHDSLPKARLTKQGRRLIRRAQWLNRKARSLWRFGPKKLDRAQDELFEYLIRFRDDLDRSSLFSKMRTLGGWFVEGWFDHLWAALLRDSHVSKRAWKVTWPAGDSLRNLKLPDLFIVLALYESDTAAVKIFYQALALAAGEKEEAAKVFSCALGQLAAAEKALRFAQEQLQAASETGSHFR